MVLRTLLLPLAFVWAVACNPAQRNGQHTKASDLLWLSGQWKGAHRNGWVVESWRQTHPDTFAVETQWLDSTGKEFLHEKIKVYPSPDGLVYQVKLPEQPPINFAHTALGNKSVAFENPANPFPQKITYSLAADSLLLIELTGQKADSLWVENFKLYRAPAVK